VHGGGGASDVQEGRSYDRSQGDTDSSAGNDTDDLTSLAVYDEIVERRLNQVDQLNVVPALTIALHREVS